MMTVCDENGTNIESNPELVTNDRMAMVSGHRGYSSSRRVAKLFVIMMSMPIVMLLLITEVVVVDYECEIGNDGDPDVNGGRDFGVDAASLGCMSV